MDDDGAWEEHELDLMSDNDASLYAERVRLNGHCSPGEAEEYWQRVRDEYLKNYSPRQLVANKIKVEDFDEPMERLAAQLVAGELE